MILAASTLLENLTDDVNCLALWDEIFDHFPLFDDTLRHIELCNSVISQIQEKHQNFANSAGSLRQDPDPAPVMLSYVKKLILNQFR